MKRIVALALTLALCLPLSGCGSAQQQGSTANAYSAQAGSSQTDAADDEEKAEPDYSTGTHHAVLTFEGYEDEVEIAVYSDEAPESAEAFCTLAEEGYYDGKTLFLVLDGLYARLGATDSDDANLVAGEFEEAGYANDYSLKTGVIALARAEDGESSDASSFIVFLSNMSYLNGQYAAFAEVTAGLDVLEDIAARAVTPEEAEELAEQEAAQAEEESAQDADAGTGEQAEDETEAQDEAEPIETNDDGQIVDVADQPVIEKIRMTD